MFLVRVNLVTSFPKVVSQKRIAVWASALELGDMHMFWKLYFPRSYIMWRSFEARWADTVSPWQSDAAIDFQDM